MSSDGLGCRGRKQFSRLTTASGYAGRRKQFTFRVARDVRPHINVEVSWIHRTIAHPMIPTTVGKIVRRAKPALITGHDLTAQRGALHVIATWAGVRLQPRLSEHD